MDRLNLAGVLTLGLLPLSPMLPVTIGIAPADSQGSAGFSPRAQFTDDVSLVLLNVTVVDGKGSFVKGLPASEFAVYEDGVLQKVRVFRREDIPVSVGLVVDSSGSMKRKRADVAKAADAFVKTSNPRDEVFVVNFNDRPTLGLPPEKLFSSDAGALGRALFTAPFGGRTALYDAVNLGLSTLSKATCDKKALVVMSDGGDNMSRSSFASVVDAAKRSNALIYCIGLFDQYDKDRNPRALRELARLTGGEAFFPEFPERVIPICKRIATEMRSQYTIAYSPSNASFDGRFRKVRVKVTGTHWGRLRVRTREGYMAAARAGGRTEPSR